MSKRLTEAELLALKLGLERQKHNEAKQEVLMLKARLFEALASYHSERSKNVEVEKNQLKNKVDLDKKEHLEEIEKLKKKYKISGNLGFNPDTGELV